MPFKVVAYLQGSGAKAHAAVLTDGSPAGVFVATGTEATGMSPRNLGVPGVSAATRAAVITAELIAEGLKLAPLPKGDAWAWDAAAGAIILGSEVAKAAVAAARIRVPSVMLFGRGNFQADWGSLVAQAAAALRDVKVVTTANACELQFNGEEQARFEVEGDSTYVKGVAYHGVSPEVLAAYLRVSAQLQAQLTADGKSMIDPRRLPLKDGWIDNYPRAVLLPHLEAVGLHKASPFARAAKARGIVLV